MYLTPGHQYTLLPKETLDQFSKRNGVHIRRLEPVGRVAKKNCPKCGGKGYRPASGQKRFTNWHNRHFNPKKIRKPRQFVLLDPCSCAPYRIFFKPFASN